LPDQSTPVGCQRDSVTPQFAGAPGSSGAGSSGLCWICPTFWVRAICQTNHHWLLHERAQGVMTQTHHPAKPSRPSRRSLQPDALAGPRRPSQALAGVAGPRGRRRPSRRPWPANSRWRMLEAIALAAVDPATKCGFGAPRFGLGVCNSTAHPLDTSPRGRDEATCRFGCDPPSGTSKCRENPDLKRFRPNFVKKPGF